MFEEPYIGMPIKMGSMPISTSKCHGESLDDMPLAMSYVPIQHWNTTYPLAKALERGTLFPNLDLPFKGGMKR